MGAFVHATDPARKQIPYIACAVVSSVGLHSPGSQPPMRLSMLALLLSASAVACQTSTTAGGPVPATPSVEAVASDTLLAVRVARAEFGDTTHVRAWRSGNGRFLLVTRAAPTTALQPIVLTSYAVVERRSGRVTASEQDVRGTVRWLDVGTVEVTLSPGTVQGDPSAPIGAPQGPPRYRVDAATGERS